MLRFDKAWSDELQQYIKTLIITDAMHDEITHEDYFNKQIPKLYFEWSPFEFVVFIYTQDNDAEKIWVPDNGWKIQLKSQYCLTLPLPKWELYAQDKFDDGICAVMFRNTMACFPQSDSPKVFNEIFRTAINEYRLTM